MAQPQAEGNAPSSWTHPHPSAVPDRAGPPTGRLDDRAATPVQAEEDTAGAAAIRPSRSSAVGAVLTERPRDSPHREIPRHGAEGQ